MSEFRYSLQSDVRDSRALFSLRVIKYFFCWLMLWQDSMVGGSILELDTYLGVVPGVREVELMAMIVLLVSLCERTLKQDFTIRKSYFYGPMILIVIGFFISWVRGQVMLQHFAGILEGHEAFAWPFTFFVVSNSFRDPEDRQVLWKLIMLAVIPKSIEGVYIYFFTSATGGKTWGVVQLWRDAYLLGIGAASLMLLSHYHGTGLRRVKQALLLATPFMGFTFIMSFRRTFLLSAFVSAVLMFVTLPRKMRRHHLVVALGFLGFMVFFALVTDPLAIIGRITGIIQPQGEGSAYIRLMEWPNVIQNILHHPILGVPVGIPWKTYYRMPVSAVYTTLGTHNTYLYWALRGGILGIVAFLWLLGKMWKSALIIWRLRKTEEDFIYGQIAIHLLILYQVSCFFGLMYAEDMPVFMAAVITVFQLQSKYISGRSSYSEVALWKTMRSGKITFTPRALRRAQAQAISPILQGAA